MVTGYILWVAIVYRECGVTKRLVELDDDLLESAQRELGTSGVSDTIRAALRHAGAAASRARQVEWLQDGGLEPLSDAPQREEVWR